MDKKEVLILFGRKISNLQELTLELRLSNEYKFHSSNAKSKIINWLKDEDKELIRKLKLTHNKKQFTLFLENYQKRLEKEETIKQVTNLKKDLVETESSTRVNIYLAISIILIAIIIFQFLFFSTYKNYPDDITLLRNLLFTTTKQNEDLKNQINHLKNENNDLLEQINKENNPTIIISSELNNTIGPRNRINQRDIIVNENNIVINKNVSIAKINSTGSMHPTLNLYSTAIQITPKSNNEIFVGDIVSYKKDDESIIHRVIRVDSDDKGWYAITKGDNNEIEDEEKVRFEQIQKVLVGILY